MPDLIINTPPLAPDLPAGPTVTDDVWVERVCRLAAQEGKILSPTEVWSSRDSALQELADEVAEDPKRRSYAQVQVIGATFAAGGASLASYTDLLTEHMRNVIHTDGGGMRMPVSMLPSGAGRQALCYERALSHFYGVIESAQLYISDGMGVAAPDGTVSFVYSNVPTLANLHKQLLDDSVRKGMTVTARAVAESGAHG